MGSNPSTRTGAIVGKYDEEIKALRMRGLGGRLIAAELNLNVGYISKRLKILGMNKGNKNQYSPSLERLKIQFDFSNGRLDQAAEHYFKFLCDASGFSYADPPIYQPYDLLVDFGDGWMKVQVKSSTNKTFQLRRIRNLPNETRITRYSANEVDFFFLYRSDGRCWLVPFAQLDGKNTVRPEPVLPNFEVTIENKIIGE